MGRKPRLWSPNYFYHIVCRGNRRDSLFIDDTDFSVYLYILKQVYELHPFEMASYCLMTNHFHLQIKSSHQPISKIMSLANKRYADYYNTKYNLTGHVFEKRYYDQIILNEIGMLKVSRYIHLNPVEAGMVTHPKDYRWSSFSPFIREIPDLVPYLNTDLLLDYFSGSENEKSKSYYYYVKEQRIPVGMNAAEFAELAE